MPKLLSMLSKYSICQFINLEYAEKLNTWVLTSLPDPKVYNLYNSCIYSDSIP